MAPQPEQQARENIDRLLMAAGWHVCDAAAANIHAARGVAIREFPFKSRHDFADYLPHAFQSTGIETRLTDRMYREPSYV